MNDITSGIIYCLFALCLIAIFDAIIPDKLCHIPTVGPSGRISSYLGALRYVFWSREMLVEGYRKHKGGIFKVAEFGYGWRVMVTSKSHIEEIRLGDDVLSASDANNFIVEGDYTMPGVHEHQIHAPIVLSHLGRDVDLDRIIPAVYDEIVEGFNQLVASSHEWKASAVAHLSEQLLCRVTNRTFVGLPLCRNPEFTRTVTDLSSATVLVSLTFKFTPEFLKPLFFRVFHSKFRSSASRGAALLHPVVEHRTQTNHCSTLEEAEKLEKPNDVLQWTMDALNGAFETLATQVLSLTFPAMHGPSTTFSHALYHLAADPTYVKVLRQEAHEVTQREGLTKSALRQMYMLDSFLKETLRKHSPILASMLRMAKKDFMFSDGTFIPKGTMVSVASDAIHHDEGFYSDPEVFNPWRFSDDGTNKIKDVTATSTEFLIFGHGRHACPGRFFAFTELKLMLIHLVLNYDVILADSLIGSPSPDIWLNGVNFPNPRVQVLFRKVQVPG
ncbi:hypothetical protein NLI96_g7662 [Meripilus lineatus]|uniref:Cytochrome P450 n=1 Tax=Meripilus lineatus TaxID=2056292 RepID=A0AAD5V0Y4_9APHY|nr:hypothetical protein NLI96_g7662 [Physisporinus lineatus]